MNTCDDCGCRVYNGVCSNCNEELYIHDFQLPECPVPVSREFMDKVDEQRERLEKTK